MQTPYEVLQDPAASNWIKDALRLALQRDPIDAMNDAQWLADYTRARFEEITSRAERAVKAGALAVAVVYSQFPADVFTAGQTSAPVCIEYCEVRG